MSWSLLAVGAAVFFYFVLVKPFRYWKNRGVPQHSLRILWTKAIQTLLQLKAEADIIQELYNGFPDQRYAGIYRLFRPLLYLRDPDLIKQITVKDFDHFSDHRPFLAEDIEPLWGKSLFSLAGDRWRDMRATLSPSFTSSKMRGMFCLMNECAEQFVRYFQTEDLQTVTVEMKDAFTRYSSDIIASTAFGIACDSLKEPENEFFMMGKEATRFRSLSFILMSSFPRLSKFLGIKLFNDRVTSFFRRVVKENVESREKKGIVRPDMIHLLMEARKGRLKHDDHLSDVVDSGFAVIEESAVGKEEKRQKHELTDDDITAQALVFFSAAFANISTFMCFATYELAVNADVQERLREEVDDTLRECGASVTYEALLKMKYLDMVVTETLRKWPIVTAVDRLCVKPYTIQPTRKQEKPVHIKKGEVLWLPIYAIHRDPKYYPDPDRFDPERFSDENRFSINPYTYLPFGIGPRSCIGNRFALLEIKTMLFHILAHFEVVVVEKSTIPLKISRKSFNVASDDGFWFGLKPRTHHTVV